MTNEQITTFIADNKGELMMDYYNKTYEKLKITNQRIDKISLYIIVLIFLYLIASKATISSFAIGPIAISDISLIRQLIPVFFSWLLLDLTITSSHKAELHTTVKNIFFSLYKQEIDPKDLNDGGFNVYSRVLLPFSYSNELSKFTKEKFTAPMGCLAFIVFIPLIGLLLLPLYFEYYMLKDIYLQYYHTNFGKVSFYLSLWIILALIYYFLNTWFKSIRAQKTSEHLTK